jgi:hypothetical protein
MHSKGYLKKQAKEDKDCLKELNRAEKDYNY